MTDISTTIGNIKLDSPFLNASGCWCYSIKELEDMRHCQSGAYVSKTITMQPRNGNREPRLFYDANLSVNSMGLPNLGYAAYTHYALTTKQRDKPFFLSISTMERKHTQQMMSMIAMTHLDTNVKGVEFNVSCPNIIGKGQMGYDMEQLKDFLDLLSDSKLSEISRNVMAIGLKMSPYFDKYQFQTVADIIREYPRLDFLTCINGIGNGLVVDNEKEESVIVPNDGRGGLGGSIVKPTGLANVKTFKRLLGDKVDIIGCGGVSNGMDAFEYFLAGASAVAVGTQLLRETPLAFGRLNQELTAIMEDKTYTQISEFSNKLNRDENKIIKYQQKREEETKREMEALRKRNAYDLSYAMC
jgi:dihydroorotate dehydrogenase (fumarate)